MDGRERRLHAAGLSTGGRWSRSGTRLDAARKEIRAGRMPTTGSRDTLRAYVEHWIARDLKARALDGDLTAEDATSRGRSLELHVHPYLGDVVLTAITVRKDRDLMLYLSTETRPGRDEPRSTSTRRQAHQSAGTSSTPRSRTGSSRLTSRARSRAPAG